ncbi:hypothetical protein BZK37_01625 [Enterococcus casseliflavus]|nr:hypothetical protein BZK37_01625 [Enterococcus casseliflavus]
MSEILKWLEEESDRLAEECHSNADPHKTVNNSFLEGFNYALANVQGLEQPQLNDNQQIVLEWLKLNYDCDGDHEAMGNIFMMYYYHTRDSFTDRLSQAIENLTNDEQIEILREYSQWALEQEEE